MPNVINYAEKWEKELVATFVDNSYIAPFVTTDVKFLDAKTFHFTTMKTSGYKNHGRNGGWNRGEFVQTDHPYTLEQDRDIEFFVDVLDADESAQTANIQNVSNTFEITQATPERDSYFFSKVAAVAGTEGLSSSTDITTITKDNVVSKIIGVFSKVKRYKNKGLILYVRSEIMDALSQAPDFNRNIDVTVIVQGGRAIETRITDYDGVQIIEVIDDDRFYTAFNYSDGFEPATGAFKINMLAATPLTTKFVPKLNSIYVFLRGTHTQGDGDLYQNRSHYDTFTFPNGKDGKVDSIYVDVDVIPVP